MRTRVYKKNIRASRAFGSEYEIENIEKRIETTQVSFIEALNPNNRVKV